MSTSVYYATMLLHVELQPQRIKPVEMSAKSVRRVKIQCFRHFFVQKSSAEWNRKQESDLHFTMASALWG